jgi:hypothetical protein
VVCAAFVYGVTSANECTALSARIVNETQCESASGRLNWTYAGAETVSNYPRGCYLIEGDGSVYFNMHAVGDGALGTKLLCAASEGFTSGAPFVPGSSVSGRCLWFGGATRRGSTGRFVSFGDSDYERMHA